MTEHSCIYHTIRVTDSNSMIVLTFRKLCDGNYYGGADFPNDFTPGPHYTVLLNGILDIIAKLAATDLPYQIEGSFPLYGRIMIDRQMNAESLAIILGCTAQEIIDYYGLMVNVRCPGTTVTTSPATPPAGQGYATKAEAEGDLTVLRSRLAGETTTENGTTDDA
jgi:hypothetical protein